MLANAEIVSLIHVADPETAVAFYTDILGLTLVSTDPFGVALSCGGRTLRLAKVQGYVPPDHSIIGWRVTDIHAAVAELAAKGVVFETYDMLEQSDDGVWTTPDGMARIAWFKDPAGNLLSLVG